MLPKSVWIDSQENTPLCSLFCIKAGNISRKCVAREVFIKLFNMWWMCLPLTEIAWSVFTSLLPRSPINRSYLLWNASMLCLMVHGCVFCFVLVTLVWQKRREDSRSHEGKRFNLKCVYFISKTTTDNGQKSVFVWCFPQWRLKFKFPTLLLHMHSFLKWSIVAT